MSILFNIALLFSYPEESHFSFKAMVENIIAFTVA